MEGGAGKRASREAAETRDGHVAQDAYFLDCYLLYRVLLVSAFSLRIHFVMHCVPAAALRLAICAHEEEPG